MATSEFTFLDMPFTLREMQVISLKSFGLYHRQIAAVLKLQPGTVKNYLDDIRKRLKITACGNLARVALTGGFDDKGFYGNAYLFGKMTGLPWQLTAKEAALFLPTAKKVVKVVRKAAPKVARKKKP